MCSYEEMDGFFSAGVIFSRACKFPSGSGLESVLQYFDFFNFQERFGVRAFLGGDLILTSVIFSLLAFQVKVKHVKNREFAPNV